MEVTEIIFAKSQDFVSSRVTVMGFFLGYRFLNPRGLDYGSYHTKMLLKVVLDKTAFVKYKISNNFKQPKTTKNPWENP
jgi:hypothetical protein